MASQGKRGEVLSAEDVGHDDETPLPTEKGEKSSGFLSSTFREHEKYCVGFYVRPVMKKQYMYEACTKCGEELIKYRIR